jgi:selenide,water dikinase
MGLDTVKLTEFTKGGGCGCKIPPVALGEILDGHRTSNQFGLVTGNSGGEDAAVFDLGDGKYLLSTTDFFTPIVDSPYDFGRIAAANSISDVYAMGGKPILALSILAWPVDKLSSKVASEVIRGAKDICNSVGIAIGGGHSIENPEPVFGLAINGIVEKENLKQNDQVQLGDELILTKPIGSGILSTALKRNLMTQEQVNELVNELVKINDIGYKLGQLKSVHALTDITGFGLIGHLLEMTAPKGFAAEIIYEKVPLMNHVKHFAGQFIYADNTMRNWKAFSDVVSGINGESLLTLCDPQTNGGLLVAVDQDQLEEVEQVLLESGQFYARIGKVVRREGAQIVVR